MVSALAVAVAVFVFVSLGARFGALGIPVALTALYALLIPAFWWALVRPACGAGFVEYHRVLLLPALATACAALAGMIVLPSVDGAPLRLLIGGTVGAAAYAGSSWVLNREWIESMSELFMVNRLRKRFA